MHAVTLLPPKALAVGDLVQARDPQGLWWNARVIEKSGRGASQAAKVRYIGFGPSADEKFTARQAGIRKRISAAALRAEREVTREHNCYGGKTVGRNADGTWEIERLLRHRSRRGKRTQYLVRWKGWDPEWDSWEDSNLDRDIIEEYEEEQAEIEYAKLHWGRGGRGQFFQFLLNSAGVGVHM